MLVPLRRRSAASRVQAGPAARCRAAGGRALRSGLLLAVLLGAPPAPPAAGAGPERRVDLVVVLSVDQLRRDRLDPALPGGLGRLAREGRVFRDALLAHAGSSTCPGHAALVTGRHPGRAGVPGNTYLDPETGTSRYCVEDRAPDARVIGGGSEPEAGRSPRALRVDTLGDWMKAATPGTRVFSVSPKDRAAVVMGGRGADGAFWLDDARGFTSSAYYMDGAQLPEWVTAWNGPARGDFLAGLPDAWEHPAAADRPDDFEGESEERSRTSPHPLRDSDPETFFENVWFSPFLDALTLDFAARLVEAESLGGGEAVDLLAIGLTATDAVGHEYGPGSAESADQLRRLDAGLDRFLDGLEQRLGEGRVLTMLSADHGVLPLPEWQAARGTSACPVEGGRIGVARLSLGLLWHMHWELSPWLSWPRSYLAIGGSGLSIRRELARDRGVPVDRAIEVAERYLEARPEIAEVWTRSEILGGSSELAELYRHSYDPERSGDLQVQLAEGCLVGFDDTGTSHGSPYAYDRAVPLVVHGPGIPAGPVAGEVYTVDAAPTLAAWLGVPVPADLDGRPARLGPRRALRRLAEPEDRRHE